MKSILATPALAIALALSLPATAAMYKWTDSEGNIVYSQMPPPAGANGTRVAPPPPPAESPAEAQRRLGELKQRLEDAREDRQLGAEKQQQAQTAESVRQKNCAAARHNLQTLQQAPRQLVSDGNGGYARMTEEQRTSEIEKAQKVIERDCD